MFDIPQDALNYLRNHFATCNLMLASDLSTFPPIYEPALDMHLIDYWSRNQAPVKLESGCIVKADAYYIGGGRHFGTWEVADIGILIIFRNNGKVIRSKLAFIQSKKLFANPLVYKKLDSYSVGYGMGRLLRGDEEYEELIKPRLLRFGVDSKYVAFQLNNEQQHAMKGFQERFKMTMYYLFYNPIDIPHEIVMPLEARPTFLENKIGCRIIPKPHLDKALKSYSPGYIPSYGNIKDNLDGEFREPQHRAGWKLEYFITDLLISCKEGVIDDSPDYQTVLRFLGDKRSPMASSLSITIDLP
jgi:hypothetical protein